MEFGVISDEKCLNTLRENITEKCYPKEETEEILRWAGGRYDLELGGFLYDAETDLDSAKVLEKLLKAKEDETIVLTERETGELFFTFCEMRLDKKYYGTDVPWFKDCFFMKSEDDDEMELFQSVLLTFVLADINFVKILIDAITELTPQRRETLFTIEEGSKYTVEKLVDNFVKRLRAYLEEPVEGERPISWLEGERPIEFLKRIIDGTINEDVS